MTLVFGCSFQILKALVGVIPFPIVVVILNLKDIFPFFLDDIGINTCCKEVIVTTLFLAPMALRISLVVMFFFAKLALKGGRL